MTSRGYMYKKTLSPAQRNVSRLKPSDFGLEFAAEVGIMEKSPCLILDNGVVSS